MPPSVVSTDTPMDLSTKTRRKLRLEEFLRQNLDQAPAAHVIQWVKRDEGVFRILWTHQSSGAFTHQDAALFRYWALARGKPANLSSVELKQSLRMALNKSPSVERLAVANDEYRYFKFTDWANRRKNSSGVKNVKAQHETARKRSPPPRLPPPLVPISYKHSSSPPLTTSDDYISPRRQDEKSALPFSQELLRKLLESNSRSSQFARENHHGEEGVEKTLVHSHFPSKHSGWTQIFPKHLIPKSQFTEDTVQRFSHPYGHYNQEKQTMDYRIREETQHDSINNNNPSLMEHRKYFSKAHSPQSFSEPQHTVPSYKDSLTRYDMDSAMSLYSDNPFYPFYHYYNNDYRSTTTPSASLYSIPDQALATPHEEFESRVTNMQH